MKKFLFLLSSCLLFMVITMQAQKTNVTSVFRDTEGDNESIAALEDADNIGSEQIDASINRAPQADYPMYTGVRYLRARQNGNNFNFDLFLTINQANGTPVSGLHVINVNTGSNTKIEGTHTITYTTARNCATTTWIVDKDKDYADDPKGQITLTYKRMGSDGYPVYRLQMNNIAACQSGSYYYFGGFDKEVTVKAYNYDLDKEITLTDYFDGISVTASNIDRYIDNTGADSEWKSWSLAGSGTGSDNKQYNFKLKYKSSATVGSFASSLADTEATELYQGTTKIEYSSVETTVTEYKTGKYKVVATFTATSGKQYMVTIDFTDDCVAADEDEPQGDVPCTAYFTLDQMTLTSQTTLGNALCNADWKTPGGWSKTFTVLQATNNQGANIKLFFSNISTQGYNGINAPVARDYAFANAGMDQDYTYLTQTNCFNPIGNENLYYYGFIYDENGAMTIPVTWYDHSNVAVGKGSVYYGNNAYFPGGNSDPNNDYIIPSYHTICPYWSYYTCPGSSTKNYFDSNDLIHVEQKADGSVFIQVRDKNDASAVYVQIGTATSGQGGTEGGEGTATPTIKLNTYVNGRGSITVSPDECLYAAGETITLTPTPDNSEWTFTGWTGECSDQITDNGDGTYTYTVPAKDCSVIANFEENAGYTLTWDFNGGITTSQDNEYTKGNVPEGEFIVAPADPTLEGYQFDGWFNSVTNNVEMAVGGMMPTQMPNNDLTYTAQWSKMQYVLVWDVNGGDALTGDYTQGEVEWGTAIIAPDDPTKEGYQFVGWISSITNEVETPLEMPSADLTYTAQWMAITYTVHFDSNHGEAADEMGDQTLTYDVEQALTANGYEWTGHTFQGWATEANGNVVYADQQTVSNLTTENNAIVNLYAVWSLDYVTVTFANPDGSELQSYQLSIGDVPAYEGTPVQENEGDEYNYFMYTFAGWIDGDNNSYGASDALPAVTGDITYTAQYNKNLFIVLQEDKDADYYTAFSDKYNGERATTVTLNRQFSQGKWATLCLPFNVNTALISALGMSNRVYEFKYTKGSETEGLTLYFSQAKKIEAGKGYIVNANATMAKKTSFVFPAVVINTEADINSGFDIANLEGYNSQGTVYLVGTLRTGLLLGSQTGSRYMGLKDNKIYYPNTAQGTSVRAYRGIFRNTEDTPVSRVRIVVEGEDGEMVDELEVVNGEIEDTATPKKVILNGILYIERNGELFDAQGKRLE